MWLETDKTLCGHYPSDVIGFLVESSIMREWFNRIAGATGACVLSIHSFALEILCTLSDGHSVQVTSLSLGFGSAYWSQQQVNMMSTGEYKHACLN